MTWKALALTLTLTLLLAVVAVGCGSDSDADADEAAPAETAAAETVATIEDEPGSGENFDRSNWDLLVSDPEAHKGASVEFVGRVFVAPERDEDGVYMQVWADPQNSEHNTIVAYPDTSFRVAADDYVRVSGTVSGEFEGTNAFGAEVSAPTVIADTIEVVDAIAAAPPAINTYGKATATQAGVRVTVSKVEFADTETRVFVNVRNDSADEVSVYSNSMKAVQGGNRLEPEYSGDYPELASELLPGAASKGVVAFPKMNPEGDLKLVVEAHSDNYDVGDFGTLTYEFTWS